MHVAAGAGPCTGLASRHLKAVLAVNAASRPRGDGAVKEASAKQAGSFPSSGTAPCPSHYFSQGHWSLCLLLQTLGCVCVYCFVSSLSLPSRPVPDHLPFHPHVLEGWLPATRRWAVCKLLHVPDAWCTLGQQMAHPHDQRPSSGTRPTGLSISFGSGSASCW